MNEVASYCSLICFCSAICVLVRFITPCGKSEKVINTVLSLFMLGIILIPLKKGVSFFDSKDLKTPNFKNQKSGFLKTIDDQIMAFSNDNIKAVINNQLLSDNIRAKKIEIFTDKNEDNCIVMIKCKIYIDKNDENKKERIKNQVEKNLNIKTKVVLD